MSAYVIDGCFQPSPQLAHLMDSSSISSSSSSLPGRDGGSGGDGGPDGRFGRSCALLPHKLILHEGSVSAVVVASVLMRLARVDSWPRADEI